MRRRLQSARRTAPAPARRGRVYCDVIDSPSFRDRGSRDNWNTTDYAILDHAVDCYLRSADRISTVQHDGPPVTVLAISSIWTQRRVTDAHAL
jgi:hypothetical protein